VLPAVADKHKQHPNAFWVLRPDSGDPVEAVLEGLKAGEKAFGANINGKGYKVLNRAGELGCV